MDNKTNPMAVNAMPMALLAETLTNCCLGNRVSQIYVIGFAFEG